MLPLLKNVVDYIFPPRCLSCPNFTLTNDGFCAECWLKINFISHPYCKLCGYKFDIFISENSFCGKCLYKSPPFNKARSLIKFDQFSKKLIHDFKYHDKTHLAKIFSKLLYYRYKEDIADVDIIAPVPMHKFKRLFRMYNQAQILAHETAKILNKPIYENLLIKYKWTKSQAFLTRNQRKKNLSKSLKINDKYIIENKKILLIDDVITTGVTIHECSKILKQAGADSIVVVSIART